MTNNLEELRKKRLKWVEANRENGFEEGIKRLLTDLYPDNAHFIYELLQNAEDPRASQVRFTLAGDAVEFEHNGERLFNIADVDSITSIGTSTKRDDPTNIGKFGVGFKAVFAYTNSPEIHSGEFHFRIHDLVVPETEEVNKSTSGNIETRFVIPFNHPTKRPAQAVEEVERALRALGDNTLLFLSHIRKLEYFLPDGSLGSLERIEHDGDRIEIRSRHPGGAQTASYWLRLQKNVEILNEDNKTETCRIAIAYSLEEDGNKKKSSSGWKIVPLDQGQVSIYFPAEKETSDLRFHIHAPFASTVARDSVRDCDSNDQLRDHIAALIVESLTAIRNQGLLTVNFLSVLPNRMDNLPSFYVPILNKVLCAFRDEPLTPTKSGTHAPAVGLCRGPARISEVLNDKDMALLINREPPLWAANPPQQNRREDRFLDGLDIGVWGWWELARTFSWLGDDERVPIEEWIAQKEDAWVMRFYALLGEAHDVHAKSVNLKTLRLVRVGSGEVSEHVTHQEAFFLPEQESKLPTDIRFVKTTVYRTGRSEAQKKFALSFLQHIGVRDFDARAVIGLRLKRYGNLSGKVENNHYIDLKQFIGYWKKNPTEVKIFNEHRFLLGESADGTLLWRKPLELCLDSPYLETGLAELSGIHKKYVLWAGYQGKFNKVQFADFVSFIKAIGVMHHLTIESIDCAANPNANQLHYDYNRGGVKWTYTAINKDYSIPGVQKYVAAQSIPASRLIWLALTCAEPKSAKARFRPNQQYPTRESESQLVYHLRQQAWIPDKTGLFQRPQDLTKDDLPIDFPFDDRNGLLTAIGFGDRAQRLSQEYLAKEEAAKGIGFSSAKEAEEIAKLINEMRLTVGQLRFFATQYQSAPQPEESVPNPERRRKGVLERRENAPSRESITRERTIHPGARPETIEAKAYLRAKYRNSEGQLVCQCCQAEMPFKVKEDHYFEAVQCVSGLDKHHFVNRLALCPTCAAMYQHARETEDSEIRRSIIEYDGSDTVSEAEITIKLAGRQFQLRFVGTHWFDLKTVFSG